MQPQELMNIQAILKNYTDTEKQNFIVLYQTKRKQQQNMLILTLVGFLGIAGIQRFVIGDTVMGIVYILTFGFCGIGTIIDLVNISNMTAAHNAKMAVETANMVKFSNL